MLIPFKDDNKLKSVPAVTLLIISVNLYIFIYLTLFSTPTSDIFLRYGAVPNNIFGGGDSQTVPPALTVFFSLFMHGSFFHLAVNMLYLWIFGHSIEDKLGHIRFLIFYIFCGVASVYIYAYLMRTSTSPLIGASGSVSGLLGGYLLLFPQSRILSLVYLGIFKTVISVPAAIIIGMWLLIQAAGGLINLLSEEKSNIAWFAHLAGFIIGLLIIRLVAQEEKSNRKGREPL